jgi:hypothetical protein
LDSRLGQISVTPTVARQTQKQEFGEVMKNTLSTAGSVISGALVGGLSASPILSAAVSSVSNLANAAGGGRSVASAAATGLVGSTSPATVAVGGSTVVGAGNTLATPTVPGGISDMMSQMRAEADRSMLAQMQMQQESRDYNTLSNVLKVRHDSAKSAINNIR